MKSITVVPEEGAVSDQRLRGIIEQGFFGVPGSLADARAACAELLFARSLIEAQTAKIRALGSPALAAPQAATIGSRVPNS